MLITAFMAAVKRWRRRHAARKRREARRIDATAMFLDPSIEGEDAPIGLRDLIP